MHPSANPAARITPAVCGLAMPKTPWRSTLAFFRIAGSHMFSHYGAESPEHQGKVLMIELNLTANRSRP